MKGVPFVNGGYTKVVPFLSKLYTASYSSRKVSEKVHATIPKGIVGGFQFSVFKTNFKEWQERPRTYVCEG